jgi:hypothetical protein
LAGNSEKRTAILKANLLSHSESKLLLNAAVEDSLSTKSQSLTTSRAIPVTVILLLAIAVHGPLLLMKIPLDSYDANTHIFFASHYEHHWFDPWNEKWYGGFSQTTYPPLTHQWIALFSNFVGLNMGYMLVQLIVLLLLPVGVLRYARLWVNDRQASYAAIGSIFLGSLALLVYQAGQLPTTLAAALTLNALPYLYEWNRSARFLALIKGLAIAMAGAAAHHVTFIFGAVLFALPVWWLSGMDRKADGEDSSAAGVFIRGLIFSVLTGIAVLVVLAPYWIALVANPITQMPIPHGSRDNYILSPHSGTNFWIIPMGALILALPYILFKGSAERRLRPLLIGWWVTTLIGLGGTTPVGKWLLGRAYEILTYERFTFWATLMALPIVAILATHIVDRYARKGIVALAVLCVATFSAAMAWNAANPIGSGDFDLKPVITFMNNPDHSKFRYLTLGFGYQFARVSTYVNSGSVDGNYNSARLLPELTAYGSGQLDNSKYFGAQGMEALRAMLKHADQYGLRYVFVRDRYYEPLLAFAGWRHTETYDDGAVTLWTKDDAPPARKLDFGTFVPTTTQGLLWGILPVAASLFAIFAVAFLPDRKRANEPISFPAPAGEPVYREAK